LVTPLTLQEAPGRFVRSVFENVGQISKGIQVVFLGGFDDAEYQQRVPASQKRQRSTG
jgi:hypothetical protein